MTPKEKAIELMDKYWELDVDDKAPIFTEKCKQCVLIALEFAINSPYSFKPMEGGWISGKMYYEEVKQEIEKL